MDAEKQKSVNPRDDEFIMLFTKHQTQLYSFIRSMVSNHSDAENILQETTVILWRKFDQFVSGTNFLAWALETSRRQILYFRQQQNRNPLAFSRELMQALDALTIEAMADFDERREFLAECMSNLGEGNVELLKLRYAEGVSVPEIAKKVNKPATTIYHKLERIRFNLLRCVEGRLNGGVAG